MNKLSIAVIIALMAVEIPLYAETIKGIDVERLSLAIYQAEGGLKAKVPFGILSVKCTGYEDCKSVCERTIRHRLNDWNGKGDFIGYLGQSYCPPNAHKLNKNWVKNVTWFYKLRF